MIVIKQPTMLQCNNGCALGRYVRSGCFRAHASARGELSGGAELASAAAAAADALWEGRAFVCLPARMMPERLGAELRVTCAGSLNAIVRRRAAARGTAHRTPHALGRCGVSRGAVSARERRVGDQRSAPPRGFGLSA